VLLRRLFFAILISSSRLLTETHASVSMDFINSNVVYGGDESYTRENTRVISWRDLPGYGQPI
jgi:hypothetical protein